MVHLLPCIHYSVHVSMNYMALFTTGQKCFLNVILFVFWSEKSLQAGVIANVMCAVALQSLSSHASQSK